MTKICISICAILISTMSCFSQEVTTLANVTANGGVTIDSDGNLFVAHFGPLPFVLGQQGKNIYKITPEGEVSLFVDGELNVGTGNQFDSNGFLYQGNFRGNSVYKIDDQGNIVDDSFATISGPVGITVIQNDTIVVCECNTSSVKKVAQDGTIVTFTSGDSFACVNGITKDDQGNIYTTNFSDGRIVKITPAGITTILGNTPTNNNGHITYRAIDQMLYIASYNANKIYRMTLAGDVELFAGTGAAGSTNSADPLLATFTKPNGIAISPDGCSLYITQDDDVIREIKFTESNCITAIENLNGNLDINLYPSPTTGTITFENKSATQFNSIYVVNSNGKTVLTIDPTIASVFDISMLDTGLYIFKLIDNSGKEYVKKVVVR